MDSESEKDLAFLIQVQQEAENSKQCSTSEEEPPQTTGWEKTYKICMIGFAVGIVLFVITSIFFESLPGLILGMMLTCVGVGMFSASRSFFPMLSLAVIGLAIFAYCGTEMVHLSQAHDFLGKHALSITLILLIGLNVAGIVCEVIRRIQQITQCTLEVWAKCVDISYDWTSGKNRRRRLRCCPMMELEYQGQTVRLYDGIFSIHGARTTKVGDRISVMINPLDPTQYYRSSVPANVDFMGIMVVSVILSSLILLATFFSK